MTLHRIVGRAGKCGPSAMAAVTGLPTHDCAALLREVTGRDHRFTGSTATRSWPR